jgi:5-(carboxyamino)imidazole ribonucleotide synthase
LSQSAFPVLLPGATIGIFGGGQLGRLTAMAARTMGYRIHVLDPDPGCPARFVVDQCVEADWTDAREAARLARACDVVTLEIEQISLASLNAAASYAPVRPSESVLEVIQDRIVQKDWLRRNGFPVGDYRAVRSFAELRDAVAALGGKCFCKSATGGYDGRGQGKVGFSPDTSSEAACRADASPQLDCHSERSEESPHLSAVEKEIRGAWEALGKGPGVVEQAVSLDREISILVARSPSGEVQVYPAAWNHHENQILAWSVIPAPLPDALAAEARDLAAAIADTFLLEGILAVELFVTTDGRLLVNELAPRPHNSYHASERACVTSQFEQLVRAVCNLPLGSPRVVQPCAIANLLGDLWLNPAPSSVSNSDTNPPSGAPEPALSLPKGSAASSPTLGIPPQQPVISTEALSPTAVISTEAFPATVISTEAKRSGETPAFASSAPTPRTPHFDRALAVPGVRLHLYEKLRPRRGRKMGHLSAVAPTPEEAVALVLRAKSLL